MAIFTQKHRQIKIKTPLGVDKLQLSAMNGTESISRLFSFELSLLSEDSGIAFKDIIGKAVTVSLELPSGKFRYFNGLISRFSQISGDSNSSDATTSVSAYRATLVPKLWLLSRSADSKIFQNKSVPEIVEEVLKANGITDFELKLQGSYDKRDYCVQYRETHFNFISRLLEDEGIYYFFEHNDSNHRMIMADSPQANVVCPGQKSASYQVEGSTSDDDVINSLGQMQEIRPNKYALGDFNFETPNNTLKADIPGKYKLSPDDREIYDYPGDYTTKSAGDKMVRVRMEEEEAQLTTVTGSGSVRAFTSGYRFALLNSFRKDMNNKEFVLTSVSHNLSQSQREGGGSNYGNSFTCIPVSLPFRPPRITPKPVVQGTQTAIVSGPAGEEIYTDKYGRIKVQFHWDRIGKRNDASSCWIRVGQAWAGNSWGALYIPRIGQEVIVDFIEGDADRPLVTGSVYHAVNMPPYPLPAEKTKSTIKSHSTLGGGGFNEFRFEDKKGQEEVYLHGQKDWNIRILNDKNQTVGNNETLQVSSNRTKSVGANQSETIGANKTITVGLDHTETIAKNMTLTVGMLATETVGINKTETIGAAKELTIGGAYQVTVGGALNETVGGAKMEEVGGYRAEVVGGYSQVDVAGDFTQSIGGKSGVTISGDFENTIGGEMTQKVTGKLGQEAQEVVISASTKLTLKCGGSTIELDASGISIKGVLIRLN